MFTDKKEYKVVLAQFLSVGPLRVNLLLKNSFFFQKSRFKEIIRH